MPKIAIRSTGPTFRRAGIAFNRLRPVEVDLDALDPVRRAALDAELTLGRHLVIAPEFPTAAKAAKPAAKSAAPTGVKLNAPRTDAGGQAGAAPNNPREQSGRLSPDGGAPAVGGASSANGAKAAAPKKKATAGASKQPSKPAAKSK